MVNSSVHLGAYISEKGSSFLQQVSVQTSSLILVVYVYFLNYSNYLISDSVIGVPFVCNYEDLDQSSSDDDDIDDEDLEHGFIRKRGKRSSPASRHNQPRLVQKRISLMKSTLSLRAAFLRNL